MPMGKGTYGSRVGRPPKSKPRGRTQGTKKGRMPLPEAQRKRLIGKNKKDASFRRKETRKRMGK
jgi:hypothetical protein|tara:strand:- start:823 stop:1014 length:192 start_codon:yes stop_codon:yes gene_type:complete